MVVQDITLTEILILAGYLATLAECIRLHSDVPERDVPRLPGQTQRLLSCTAVNSLRES